MTDLNIISNKVTAVILSCTNHAHIYGADKYVERVSQYIREAKLMSAKDADIYCANLRGRLMVRIAQVNKD